MFYIHHHFVALLHFLSFVQFTWLILHITIGNSLCSHLSIYFSIISIFLNFHVLNISSGFICHFHNMNFLHILLYSWLVNRENQELKTPSLLISAMALAYSKYSSFVCLLFVICFPACRKERCHQLGKLGL